MLDRGVFYDLSHSLFNIFINMFVVRPRQLDIGCHMNSLFIGYLLYADDMLQICPSVNGLQNMLDLCMSVSSDLSLQFNPAKSHCIAVGMYVCMYVCALVIAPLQDFYSEALPKTARTLDRSFTPKRMSNYE